LHALRDCLSRDEAVYVGTHLPALLRGLYYDDPAVDAEQVARAVFALLAAHMPPAELEDAKAATPKPLHNLWPS
jgi:uncharacterized protein (DUF2267 family)